MAIPYHLPQDWISYDPREILAELAAAKAAMLALTEMPYQRSWADELQQIQLKREVAGTSRIEGAEFSDKELEAAITHSPEELETRSQKQAAAAVATYKWIALLEDDLPITTELICEIHRKLVTGCDDDHCPPGKIRGGDQNVTFGSPRHRGVDGGEMCQLAIQKLVSEVQTNFQRHDVLIRAFALHYHFAAMHPFLDGNGRTARALEALMLQRTGLKDTLFIAMSNYYYEEKNTYLKTLAETRAHGHNLTIFLKFALRGVELQCKRLIAEIRENLQKALFRNTITDLFGRLESPRKRVISERHAKILHLLLDRGSISLGELIRLTTQLYTMRNPQKAIVRDLNHLISLGAIGYEKKGEPTIYFFSPNLLWPTQITETEFFKRVKDLPKGKLFSFLSS